MKRAISTTFCLTLLLTSSHALTDGEPEAASLAEGKALIKAKGCIPCHGLSGNTGYETEPPTPKLAGQPRAYLVKTMQDYRSGARQSETMNAIMENRTDAEIDRMADYYHAQKRY